jgi:hypothetical protein
LEVALALVRFWLDRIGRPRFLPHGSQPGALRFVLGWEPNEAVTLPACLGVAVKPVPCEVLYNGLTPNTSAIWVGRRPPLGRVSSMVALGFRFVGSGWRGMCAFGWKSLLTCMRVRSLRESCCAYTSGFEGVSGRHTCQTIGKVLAGIRVRSKVTTWNAHVSGRRARPRMHTC